MNTLHINTERTWRGGEQQTLLLLLGLRARGHAASLIAPPGSPLAGRARDRGIEVREIRMRGEADPIAVLRIRRAIARGKFDILHMHTSHAHSLGGLASAGLPIARIVSRRVDFSIFRNSFLGLNRWKYGRWVDRYVAVSSAIRDVLSSDGVDPARVSVVRSGVDPARFPELDRPRAPDPELPFPPGSPIVGNVAHLAPHKGQVHLIQAAPRVLAREPRARFLIVGHGELAATFRRRIAALGLEGTLVLTGFREDIGAILARLSVFVMPSVQEGLGTSIVDAMLFGLPVVASRVGGIPEIIDDGVHGILCPPGDEDALAEAIAGLLRSPDRARILGEAGRRRAKEEFSVDRMVDGTARIYAEVLAERRARAHGSRGGGA
ncbi:MAG: glycosyltransferase [Planctomycetes bacterium]|nr:glycosyltransferase [Planctomycetota bacterium]